MAPKSRAVATPPSSPAPSPATSTTPAFKVANLYDGNTVKQTIDDAIVKYFMESQLLVEDHFISNTKIAMGTFACILALIAQFYPLPFPQNKDILIVCAGGYFVIMGILQYISSFQQKDYILITKKTDKNQPLKIATSLPRFDDMMTIRLEQGTSESSVQRSVSSWLDSTGVLHEDKLARDLEDLRKKLTTKTN
eukprot:TRINITY_DN670_c1_g1_i1.p1 TRINITY_DN670_c1_g1~~TRINITY_DN670_c1_g1_i1.p1  ORF type:complete len:194 (-),score=52.22 TRINITY_DN670_c1_g1_i1:42-623(-)